MPDRRGDARDADARVGEQQEIADGPAAPPGGEAGEVERFFAETLADRRKNPQEDLLSMFVSAEVGGEKLTDDEIRRMEEMCRNKEREVLQI